MCKDTAIFCESAFHKEKHMQLRSAVMRKDAAPVLQYTVGEFGMLTLGFSILGAILTSVVLGGASSV